MGNTYLGTEDYKKALTYYQRYNNYATEVNDSFKIAVSYFGIANVKSYLGDNKEALRINEKCQDLVIAMGPKYKNLLGSVYTNSATFSYPMGNKELANKYLDMALEIKNAMGNPYEKGQIYAIKGEWKADEKQYEQAINNYLKAIEYYEIIDAKDLISETNKDIATAYYHWKKPLLAYDYLTKHLDLNDSLYNNKQLALMEEMTAKYEGAEKEKEIIFLNQQHKVQEVQIQKNETILYISLGALAIFLLLLIWVFINYRQKQKAFSLLSVQKAIITENNREILDSIKYAERIQNAILPSPELIKKALPDSFILYQPKDIVAGDFYWIHQLDEDTVIYAAADCTGHGVPGAMLSVVCNNALLRSIKEFKLTQPAKILDKAAEIVADTFERSEEECYIKDGMDISLCSVNYKTGDVQFSGANNALYLIKEGVFTEIKGDKQPVGQYSHTKPFTNHTFKLNKGDVIYSFTDGYPDQFGGPKGKKFMYKQFRELLISISQKNMATQQQELTQVFNTWKGEHEQVDDLCVIGVRV